MNFISRYSDEQYYGVVDSETGRERIVGYVDLLNLVQSGIRVAGVSVDPSVSMIDGGLRIQKVEVWEGLRPKNPQAIKLFSLSGVDIRVYKEYISYIGWEPSKLPFDVSIRLSDFGSICADRCFMWHGAEVAEPHHVTFILDDNIVMLACSIRLHAIFDNNPCNVRVCFDLTEVTSSTSAEYIYSMLYQYFFTGSKQISVLDDPVRYRMYQRKLWG